MADSSSSSSFSSSSSDKDQRHQATAQVKERTPPLNKMPAAGKRQPQSVASPSSLGKKPAASKERQKPVHSSNPDEPPSAAASQQMRPEKKRKQQQDGASVQEGEAAAAGGLSSKKPFQKVWAEDDEIALLEAMLSHPTASDIPVAVGGKFSKKQTSEKLRKLKKKYKKHLRWGDMGVGLSLINSHDQRVFELSKKVWPTVKGDAYDYDDDDDDDEVRTNGEGGKMGRHRLEQRYPMLGEALHLLEEDGDNLLPRSTSRVLESAKLKILESQWEKHFKAGVKYCLERARMKEDLLGLIVKLP